MRNKFVLLFFVSFLSFFKLTAISQDFVFSQIRESLVKEDAQEAYRWLTLLEEVFPEKLVEARVIKSFVLGAFGNENEGIDLLLNNLAFLRDKGFNEKHINSIYNLFNFASKNTETEFNVIGCNGYQPKGLSLKYWLGAAALMVGVVTIPFGNPASPWLIGTGAAVLIDTVPDLLENKENHDRGLPPYDAETQRKINEYIQQNNLK